MLDSNYRIEIKMSSVQPNLKQLSLNLSKVLEDIGVNDKIIQKRRESYLFQEQVYAVSALITCDYPTQYYFGSQSEGTTTNELSSDLDKLTINDYYFVIDDLSNWQNGKRNLLMVQDETTSPGYCLLQLLRDDVPQPAEYVPDDQYCLDDKSRVVFKHLILNIDDRRVQHGPAATLKIEGKREVDDVIANYCSKWPLEATKWLTRDNVDGWPNASLKSKCEKSGCFLVPVDNKISGLAGKEVEWRISTAFAERYLMFSLNTTHLKCYVLMKLMLKKYTVFHDVISSYMCKTVLLHCVENTKGDFWRDTHLITCFNKLLSELYNNIAHLNCPHFIIPNNNLMAGRISPLQQQKLLKVLDELIKSEGNMLLDVQIDELGDRLRQKHVLVPKIAYHTLISGELFQFSADKVIFHFRKILLEFSVLCHKNSIQKLKLKYIEICNIFAEFDITKRKAANHFTPLMSTTIGTLMASYSISIKRPIPNEAIVWLVSGLNSDISSSMLKLATVYYSSRNMNAAVDLLTRVDQRYDRNNVIPVCGCKEARYILKKGFYKAAYKRQLTKLRRIVSYCVCFMNHDIYIVPSELRQEFERSSQEELHKRLSPDDEWMDFAVIDSLPYLYFLQYKTYHSLGRTADKQNALEKLENVMDEEPWLSHTETVFNILGQCMEHENRPNDALKYYKKSLQIRSEHNAANYYISRLKR